MNDSIKKLEAASNNFLEVAMAVRDEIENDISPLAASKVFPLELRGTLEEPVLSVRVVARHTSEDLNEIRKRERRIEEIIEGYGFERMKIEALRSRTDWRFERGYIPFGEITNG